MDVSEKDSNMMGVLKDAAGFGSLTRMNSTWKSYFLLTCASTLMLETICIPIRFIEHFYNCAVFKILLQFI